MVAGIVLAAGSATRMGRNKLLLEVGGETLLRRAVRCAIEAGLEPVIVVLGHEADRTRAELRDLACSPVENPDHARGMNTSLGAGIAALPGAADAAVVLLADMPLVDAAMIRAVVERHAATRAPVVTARYGEVTAPPTLYGRAIFQELQGRDGEGLGREVVRRHRGIAESVPFAAAALIDVDRAGDLDLARRAGGARSGT